jgi:hypothetical protein
VNSQLRGIDGRISCVTHLSILPPHNQNDSGSSLCVPAWDQSSLTSSRWLKIMDFIGAGILAGLAGLMASESTGVKAPPAAP